MRCAIYARYSSDLQRESSIEDQVRKCREYARTRGWTILDDSIRCDRAVSAGAMAGREGLQALIAEAKQKPRPFDCILVDDTSRLARNLEDSLRTVKLLDFYGVCVSFASQQLDSADKSSRNLLTMYGMMDEQFLVGLADKVHRGQEGQVLKGLQAGGRCYGYRNVPIEDPTRLEKYGRPAVLGVRLEIEEAEAAVVRRIYDMYGRGSGLAQIAKILNAEGTLAPQPPRTRTMRAWCVSSLHEILRNERYRGVYVWNRTEKRRNPETGRKVSKARPESQWLRILVPDWRIVSDQQWAGIEERLRFIREHLPYTVTGGINRTAQSRTYLFSGLLFCGTCNSRMVIVSGAGKRGYVKYGCPSHRYRGVCANRLTIRRDRLESQLLNALETRILRPDMAGYLVKSFEKQLRARIKEMESRGNASGKTTMEKRREELRLQTKRISAAIGLGGDLESLVEHLKAVESEITALSDRLNLYKPINLTAELDVVHRFALENVMSLRGILRSEDIPAARTTLQRHIGKLVLTPTTTDGGLVFQLSGSIDLLPKGGSKGVMQVVARDGIEPPTPAFSGLRSTD